MLKTELGDLEACPSEEQLRVRVAYARHGIDWKEEALEGGRVLESLGCKMRGVEKLCGISFPRT